MNKFPTISEYEIQNQVLNFMQANGLTPHANHEPIIDGKIHRYTIEGDRVDSKNGSYCIFPDGDTKPAGWFKNWRTGETLNWSFDLSQLNPYDLERLRQNQTPEAIEAHRCQREEEKLQREKERRKSYLEAARKAQDEYERSKQISEANAEELISRHPYTTKKHIPASVLNLSFKSPCRVKINSRYGDVSKDGDLLIPLLNINSGAFQGLQIISPDLNKPKKFYKGMTTEGAFFALIPQFMTISEILQETGYKILIAEGVATGASVFRHSAAPAPYDIQPRTPPAVFMCMTCGNMKNIAQALRQKFPPHVKIVVMADYDKTQKNGRNAGIDAANECLKLGLCNGISVPPIQGMDWNDFLISEGLL